MVAGGFPKGIHDQWWPWAWEQSWENVCKSHGFSWGWLIDKLKGIGSEILFLWLTGVSYMLQWELFNEGKGFVPLRACITQGVWEDALRDTVIDFFLVCAEPESLSFPCRCVLPHSHLTQLQHCSGLKESAVADVARSYYGPWAGVGHHWDTACTFHYRKA